MLLQICDILMFRQANGIWQQRHQLQQMALLKDFFGMPLWTKEINVNDILIDFLIYAIVH